MAETTKKTCVQDERTEVQGKVSEHENEPVCDETSNIETKDLKIRPAVEALIATDILKTNRVKIVNKLNIKDALPCLEEHLLPTEMDNIRGMKSQHGETGCLIDILHRRCCAGEHRAFNAFLKIVAGNQPDLFSELVGRAPTEEEMDFCVQHFTEALKKVIEDKGHCTDSPLDIRINLDEEHIQLHVVKEQSDSPKTASDDDSNQLPHAYQAYLEKLQEAGGIINAQEVLGTTQNQTQKLVIRGLAGVGKTTTMQWFARRWSLGEWATGITLLFLLQLRYLTDTASMVSAHELLTMYGLFKLEDKMMTMTCHSWLKNSGNRLLILMDGLDEISNFAAKLRNAPKITDIYQKANPVDLCVNIIRGNIFPDCTIICTSRPFTGLGELTSFSKLEILGLTRVGVKDYVHSKYHDNSKYIMSVLTSLPILMSLCSITFYCMLICSLLNDNVTLEEDDVQSYTRLIACIMVKHVSRKLPNWPFVVEVNAYLSKLAKLAYNGIFQSKQGLTRLVFDEFDLAEVKLTPSDLEAIKKVGLLQIKETENKSCKSVRAEFLHLSVQEMLAVAYCLSDESITYDLLAKVFSGGQFDMALLYLFGLCFDKKSLWIKNVLVASGCNLNRRAESLIAELFNDMCSKPVSKLKICQLVHEAQVESHARAVIDQIVADQAFTIQQIPMTILDLNALNFVCQHATGLSGLMFANVNADDTFVRVLSSSFLRHHCSTLQVLNVSCNRIQSEGAKIIAEALKTNRSLTGFNIAINKIGSEGAIAIAGMLKTKENLQLLNISANSIGPVGAKAVAEALSQKSNLKTLHISGNDIQLSGVKAIAECIHGNPAITDLDISANNIGDSGMRAFVEVLQDKSSLCNLNISHNTIGHNGAKAIGKLLCQNTTITSLNMSQNLIGENVPKALIKGIQSLQFLDISGNGLHAHGATALFSALQGNATLQRLNISTNFMRESGIKELCRMLKENSVLQSLVVHANDIGVAGGKELAAAIQKNSSLRELSVGGNDIGVYGEATIRTAMAARNAPLQVSFGTVDLGGPNASLQVVQVQNYGASKHGLSTIKFGDFQVIQPSHLK